MNAPYNFVNVVAFKVLDLLVVRKAMLHQAGTVFYLWQRGDRVIVSFDPDAIDHKRVDDDFAHMLSTNLHGRLVVRTNSRGIFLQVGFETPPVPMFLEARPLDLNQQPTPFHMPIGITKDGPLWLSLIDGDSFLVGGSRRMGKSGFTHGMIQALLHGGQTQVYGWDGKDGLEYQAYIGLPNFHFMANADRGLQQLSNLLAARKEQLKRSGYVNTIEHNKAGQEFIEPIALFVDEIALLDDRLKLDLKHMIEYYGAAGLYPVLATNDPLKDSILVKSNLSTRISFSVPSFNDSMTVLGRKGAEALTKRRGLVLWENRSIEFHSFNVPYPVPTDEQRRLLAEMQSEPVRPLSTATDGIAEMADSIREQWTPKMSKNAVSKLLANKPYSGASWTAKVDRVIEYLRSSSSTGPAPDSGSVAA